jgi:bleomycin hydrolase
MNRAPYLLGIVFCSFLFIGQGFNAAFGDGLDQKTLDHLRDSCKLTGANRAIYNAATGNSLSQLALSREVLDQDNDLFSNVLKGQSITNQKGSERCWLFAALNVLRPEVMKKFKLETFELSENYLSFWDKLEKANRFLDYMIELADRDPLDREMSLLLRRPVDEGGWWDYVAALIEKYGVVPADAMPEASNSDNSGLLFSLLGQKLRVDAVALRKMKKNGKTPAELQAAKQKMLEEVYRILVLSVGEPPRQFAWRYAAKDGKPTAPETITPQRFYKEKIGIDLSQYVSVMNHPMHPYGKNYVFARSRNMSDGKDLHFPNVESAEMKEWAIKSICDGQPVWFGCDVGRDQDRGMMALGLHDYQTLFGVDLTLDKADGLLMRGSISSHAMVLVGVDLVHGKPLKWKVENSWGKDKGKDGYWHLYDSWFDKYVYQLVIRKAYLPARILKLLEEEPTTLPMWDPLAE